MDWNTAKLLASALLEAMGFDPFEVIGLTPDALLGNSLASVG